MIPEGVRTIPALPRDRYPNYAELAANEREGVDYRIISRPVPGARVAVMAPHGGGIERGTSELSRAIAGEDFHLYLFEGLKARGNFKSLHITSRRFDEPRCLDLLRQSENVITIHGCAGLHQAIYLGGLDVQFKSLLAKKLLKAGIDAHLNGHSFLAVDTDNLCNRGLCRAGVQLELTAGLRRTRPSTFLGPLIRDLLLAAPF